MQIINLDIAWCYIKGHFIKLCQSLYIVLFICHLKVTRSMMGSSKLFQCSSLESKVETHSTLVHNVSYKTCCTESSLSCSCHMSLLFSYVTHEGSSSVCWKYMKAGEGVCKNKTLVVWSFVDSLACLLHFVFLYLVKLILIPVDIFLILPVTLTILLNIPLYILLKFPWKFLLNIPSSIHPMWPVAFTV